MKKNMEKTIFESWLGACMHGPIGDHVLEEMALNADISMVDEETQLSWFDNEDWEAVRTYKGRWYKSASLRLLDEAPCDVVKQYLLICVPLDEIHQEILVKRDIRDGSDLSWNYFVAFSACESVQKLIREHDIKLKINPRTNRLWFCVMLRNYVWPLISEQAMSAETEKLLLPYLTESVRCPWEDLPAKISKWLKL